MTKSKTRSVFRPQEKIPHAQNESIRRHQSRTGEIIWAWNHLHHRLQLLFMWIGTPTEPKMGEAIWHVIRTDTVQRAVLRAALKHVDQKSEPRTKSMSKDVSEGLEWLLDTVGKLAPFRNDVAHTPTIPGWTKKDDVHPSWLANPDHWKRMAPPRKLRTIHRHLRDDLHILINYAAALDSELTTSGTYTPFPQPPSLKSLAKEEIPLTRSQRALRKSARARKTSK